MGHVRPNWPWLPGEAWLLCSPQVDCFGTGQPGLEHRQTHHGHTTAQSGTTFEAVFNFNKIIIFFFTKCVWFLAYGVLFLPY